jgi:pyridoxine/pyridoxamine 5'-phosphate oxidase
MVAKHMLTKLEIKTNSLLKTHQKTKRMHVSRPSKWEGYLAIKHLSQQVFGRGGEVRGEGQLTYEKVSDSWPHWSRAMLSGFCGGWRDCRYVSA